jgi:hypothetical protein
MNLKSTDIPNSTDIDEKLKVFRRLYESDMQIVDVWYNHGKQLLEGDGTSSGSTGWKKNKPHLGRARSRFRP